MSRNAPELQGLWQRAARFAARAHRHQVRKDGVTPYFSHPCRVAMTVAVVFGCVDEVALSAALLHDTIEDTTTDFDDLAEEFGVEVAEIVASLTKNMAMPEKVREADYAARLSKADWRARLIKLADQHDNVCDAVASGWSGEKMKKVVGKAEHAATMAEVDAAAHGESARAIAALRERIAGAKGGL